SLSLYYPLPLHDALPILRQILAASVVAKEIDVGGEERSGRPRIIGVRSAGNRRLTKSSCLKIGLRHDRGPSRVWRGRRHWAVRRSEEHTSELQSPDHLVC